LKYLDAMATSTPSKEEIVRQVAQFAAEQPTVLAAYLFGSAAQNRLADESDVDIGLLFETSPEALRLLELQEVLTTALNRQSDLVSLNQASPILAMQVLKHGEIVFERSQRAVREFQVRTLFAYFDLKQVRKPIEEALLSS
jgi:predicted nucleotidyltransferase